MPTEPYAQPYPDGDDESWDLQFDAETVEPVEEKTAVPFRPLGLEH